MASCHTHAPTFLKLPPTDGTDQHRCLGGAAVSAAPTKQTVSFHRTHGTHRIFLQRRASHRWHRSTQMFRGCSSLCCTNKASSGTPTDSTDLHRCRRVWHPAVPTQSLTQPNHLWASVKSVGGSSTPEISVSICEICGRTSEGGVGMAGMPYPPIQITRS